MIFLHGAYCNGMWDSKHDSVRHRVMRSIVVVVAFVFSTQFASLQMEDSPHVFEERGFTDLWSSKDEDMEQHDSAVEQDMDGGGSPVYSAGNGGMPGVLSAHAHTRPEIDNTMNANQEDRRAACLLNSPIATTAYRSGAPVYATWRSEDG